MPATLTRGRVPGGGGGGEVPGLPRLHVVLILLTTVLYEATEAIQLLPHVPLLLHLALLFLDHPDPTMAKYATRCPRPSPRCHACTCIAMPAAFL